MLCSTIPPVFAYHMLNNKKSAPRKVKNSPNITEKVGLGVCEEENPAGPGRAGGLPPVAPGDGRGCSRAGLQTRPGRELGEAGRSRGEAARLGRKRRKKRKRRQGGGREEGAAHARGRPGVLARRPASEVVEKQ